ncbi:MAG: hypothetical protein HC769_11135 [Cyanobacteria bacterium CRU_2_1]|nr:hypothetical protein [Cyanobacteria bacterium RU_5_0]NJR59347.1 hypothetical protein [Cyanobacteria bacterium CRU_2_1]
MMAHKALEIVNHILEPKRLNYAQEMVFLQSWSGKIYREIALESGYDLDYIKEVGSQLWSYLSDALGERVTKKNVRLILTSLYGAGTGIGEEPLALAPHDLEAIEFPSGAVSTHSHLYIERPPIEERVYAEITRPGSLVRIKAPKQMGKTSLVYRLLIHAKRLRFNTVMLNFQKADSSVFTSLNRFLRWFCLDVSRQLNLEPKLNEFWDEEIGSKVSCTTYFQDYLLTNLSNPVVLALDEVNRVFEYPELAQDFLPLLRAWHEEAAEQEKWQKLRLVVVHSTEVYVPLNINQSPFNVGLPIQLPEFSQAQMQELAKRHGLKDNNIREAVPALMVLVGGHPYLTRLALYWLQQGEITLTQLLQEAPTQAGIYSNHLRRHWEVLQAHPNLWTALRQVVTATRGVRLESITAYRLESMGLVKLRGNEAVPACELYRLYFSSQVAETSV